MRIIELVSEMQQLADQWRRQGKRIGFIPTMGFLHEGHLALMREAKNRADVVAVSVFVNPTQFGPNEDFERYPRDMQRDVRLCTDVGVDVIFAPSVPEMYPEGFQTGIEVSKVTIPLCGRSRPGHFVGVATVVTKLFNSVKPHLAIFGQKDYQQWVVIRRMVQDLNMDIEVVGHPTVREPDGLAMSSRNSYLSPDERQVALRLSRSLKAAQDLVDRGETGGEVILEKVRDILDSGGGLRIDYVQLCHPDTLEEAPRVDEPAVLLLAAFVGKTRLIDNCVLRPGK
ncbi:MAG TPA: pantoate--beta-alanine ligase [Syntrophobacteraceae bacterium]|nr:pantoate--beta-alanine ligase [Syntrophobacteraceae bacterium]